MFPDASYFEVPVGVVACILSVTNYTFFSTESGIQAAEVGCGTGILSCHLAAMFPNSHFTTTDLMSEPLERARQRAQQNGITNITFTLLNVCQVPDDFKEKFDWLVAQDVIHDLPHPQEALQGIFKALKPGGHFSLVDEVVSTYVAENLSTPDSTALYSLSTFMCVPESYQQEDSEALGACWGKEKATEMATKAGFKVLGLTRSEELGTYAVIMCQKPG